MRAKINQYDSIFAAFWVRLEQEDDPAIIFNPACPQSIETSLELVRLERWVKWVSNQLIQRSEDPYL